MSPPMSIQALERALAALQLDVTKQKAKWEDKLKKKEVTEEEYEQWIDGDANLTDEIMLVDKLKESMPKDAADLERVIAGLSETEHAALIRLGAMDMRSEKMKRE